MDLLRGYSVRYRKVYGPYHKHVQQTVKDRRLNTLRRNLKQSYTMLPSLKFESAVRLKVNLHHYPE